MDAGASAMDARGRRDTTDLTPPFVVFGKHNFAAGQSLRGMTGLFPRNFITFENIAMFDVMSVPHVRAAYLSQTGAQQAPAPSSRPDSSPLLSSIEEQLRTMREQAQRSLDAAGSSASQPPPVGRLSLAPDVDDAFGPAGQDGNAPQRQASPLQQQRQQQQRISQQGQIAPSAEPSGADAAADAARPKPEDVARPSGPTTAWSVDDVASWIERCGFAPDAVRFRANGIDGAKLMTASLTSLRDIGIEPLSQRMLLMQRILYLQENSSPFADSDSIINSDDEDNFYKYSFLGAKDAAEPSRSAAAAASGRGMGGPEDIFAGLSESFTGGLAQQRAELKPPSGDPSSFDDPVRSDSIRGDSYSLDRAQRGLSHFTVSDYQFDPDAPRPDMPMPPKAGNRNSGSDQDDGSSSGRSRFGASLSRFAAKLSRRGSRDEASSQLARQLDAAGLTDGLGDGSSPNYPPQSFFKHTEIPSSELVITSADYEGWLLVRAGGSRGWKRRYCALKDYLVYLFKSSNKQQVVAVIPLNSDTEVLPGNPESTRTRFAFMIQPRVDPTGMQTFHLAAETQLAMVGWLNILVRAARNSLRSAPVPLLPIKDARRVRVGSSAGGPHMVSGIDATTLAGHALRQTTLRRTPQPGQAGPGAPASSSPKRSSTMPSAKFVPLVRPSTLAVRTPSPALATSPPVSSPLSPNAAHAPYGGPHGTRGPPLASNTHMAAAGALAGSGSIAQIGGLTSMGSLQRGQSPTRRTAFDDSIDVPLQRGMIRRTITLTGTKPSQPRSRSPHY
ncbi:hypothetical protein HK105_205309 [Polyrhizophydium stewartii]|uniref:SAM domain-containing protein n=1 Tax=Polyrhizophydium stewartii TaxID=2732419 RepID=A0ABR4N6P6_9FUNG